jgi:hypothetical protein
MLHELCFPRAGQLGEIPYALTTGPYITKALGLIFSQARLKAPFDPTRVMANVKNYTGPRVAATWTNVYPPPPLVVDEYSHGPVHETFFGGVTASLSAQAETPVFMH